MQLILTLDDQKFGNKYCDAVHAEVIDELGIHTAKYVDLKSLLELLHMSMEDTPVRIGELPSNLYDGLMLRQANGQVTAIALIVVPGHIGKVMFEGTLYTIPYPTLLFRYAIKDSVIQQTLVYALKTNNCNRSTGLYNYPFGNVSTGNHAVCWGPNELPQIANLKTLDVVTSLFLDSPCNNDHYDTNRSTTLKYSNLRGVFEHISEMETFPEDILVDSYQTIASLIGE